MTPIDQQTAHPPVQRNRMLLLTLGTGAAVGLHLGLLHLFMWKRSEGLEVFFTGAICFSMVTYWLWRWVFPSLHARRFSSQLVAEALVATIVYGALSVVVVSIGAHYIGAPSMFGTPTGIEEHITITPQMRQVGVRTYALLPIVPSVLTTLITYHLVWLRMATLQTRARELGELAATAQLAALRAQMNPHFLFNSLNSIAQLIHVDPVKAEVCVERLAEIFRYLLNRAEQDFVPLADELQMTNAYLDIERARFDERLRVETAIDPKALRRLIPNLILQPLVENAVKHGLSRKVGPGTLRIEAGVDGDTLMLVVDDDGLGMSPAVLERVYERGVGLRNLRARLERLYGPSHPLEIASAPGEGTRVCVRLPHRDPDTREAA
jgi:signal transduction histidine kinase